MKIYSVYDPEFKPYGCIHTGLEEACAEILSVLKDAPCGEAVEYVPEWAPLQELPAMVEISEHCYGGMPVQLGWCNGHNTKLNCLEYHRDSEFNLGVGDFILLVAKLDQVENGILDTAKVKAFHAPAGALVECYATTLHYAPCSAKLGEGFRVLIALPKGTNLERPVMANKTAEDELLTACNKWLLAHPESSEAKNGAKIGLSGENIDIANYI